MSAESPKSLLIAGESGAGKSFSLMNIKGPEGVLYLNCEGGKPLPFKNKFKRITIEDPLEVFEILERVKADTRGRYHTIIFDTVSFLMNRYESVHVIGAQNTMQAWGQYGQYFPKLIYDYVAPLEQHTIMLGHLEGVLNEETQRVEYKVPVKGALAKNGIEAYFTTVLYARKMAIKDIEKEAEEGPMLTITERDRNLGYKHVLQTRTTKQTVGDKIRSPWGLFKDDETYIDNDVQAVIDRLKAYYAD
jgi:hypothetical protein